MDSMEPMQSVQPVEPAQAEQPTQPAKPKKVKKERNPQKAFAIVLAVAFAFVSIFSIISAISANSKIAKLESDSEYYKQMFNYYNYLIESGQIVLEEGESTSFDSFVQNNSDEANQEIPSDDSQQDNSSQSADPSKWTTAEIVETYKHAARKTHTTVTSYQDMKMREGSLSAPGIAEALVEFSEGVMAQALSNNSMNIKGITGGHQNLVVSDVQSAKAYKSGNNIVIEMRMKEQIDKGNGNMYSGTVGHAISVVGDIDSVIGQFSGLGMEASIADEDVTLHYKNPIVKVAINSSGYIINGTWSYYVNVTLNNLTISAMGLTVPVPTATSIIDFVVTLNGGFKG